MRCHINTTTIGKQFIVDDQGRQIGVILPIEDYNYVEPLLRQHEQRRRHIIHGTEEERLRMIEQAANDPLFLADLQEVMSDFANVDAEWWERR